MSIDTKKETREDYYLLKIQFLKEKQKIEKLGMILFIIGILSVSGAILKSTSDLKQSRLLCLKV